MSFLKKKEGLDRFKNQYPPTCSASKATHLYAIENNYMSNNGVIFAKINTAYKIIGVDFTGVSIIDESSSEHKFPYKDLHKWFVPINEQDVKKENKEIIWRI